MKNQSWIHRLYTNILNGSLKIFPENYHGKLSSVEDTEEVSLIRQSQVEEFNILIRKLSEHHKALHDMRRKVLETKIQLLLDKTDHETNS